MSFIITIYTNEGIIMASDSRSTGSVTSFDPTGIIHHNLGTQITDTTYKTFMCNKRIGLSTCGAASINNIPITGYIERFIDEKINDDISVNETAEQLNKYFNALCPKLPIHFIISGYNKCDSVPIVKQIKIEQESVDDINTSSPNALWDGEILTLSKLFTQLYSKEPDGTFKPVANYGINCNFFTLQDAINFAEYAVDITIKTMAFENCVKTVGGPIDILAIKPTGAFWIARKELHA